MRMNPLHFSCWAIHGGNRAACPGEIGRLACICIDRVGICCFLSLDVIPSIEDLCRCCASDIDNNSPLKLQNSEPNTRIYMYWE